MGQNIHGYHGFSWFLCCTINILPTNEATFPTFTCRANSNHENIIHEVTKYCSTTNVLPPKNYPLYGIALCTCII